jgi:enoyl-CoA hydratase/carnithine racemase
MSDLVTIETSGGIADVRLNRPDKYNALSPDMFKAIIEAGESLAEAREVRAVVLSGNGRGFCAGLDMASFQSMAETDQGREGAEASLFTRDGRPENRAQRPTYVWKNLPMPVIAAVHGVAYGGGCQIALGADIRFATPDAKFSVMEIKWGLVPDMALTQTLRDLVPLDVAKELTFSGRVVSGTEAAELGLVTHVSDDPLAAAMGLAEEIAGKSPDAVRAGKRLFEESWRADAEAVMANFEKRPPRFED